VEYSALPALLLELGAVLYCKTNVPQTMMTADSDNNVFGRTLNPSNLKLTAGGSTGGEGALIAMRGSILGVGTDIAGSIRIPSLCNGIYGFKPSANVVPMSGQQDVAPEGMPGITPVAGPMATSPRACTFFMRTVMEARPWRFDHECLHLRWSDAPLRKGLRLGFVCDDGMFTLWPPVRRALNLVAEKLKHNGIDIVPLDLPLVKEAVEITYKMYSLDGCEVWLRLLCHLKLLLIKGQYVQNLIARGAEPLVRSVKNVDLASIKSSSLPEFISLNANRSRIQEAYTKLWLEHDLDAILCPPAPTTATPLDRWDSITYTMLWNFLDYPSCILPVGKVSSADIAGSVTDAKHGERDQANFSMCKFRTLLHQHCRRADTFTDTGPADFANAPLAIQLVGMRQEDAQLAQLATLVDDILRFGGRGCRL
jgi:amidase